VTLRWEWWKEKDPSGPMLATLDKVREADYGRKCQMVEQLCLYANQNFGDDSSIVPARASGQFERLSQNHIENMILTVYAEAVQNRTRMTVVTSGGDYKLKKRAKGLDKWLEGQAEEDGQEEIGNDVKLDALIWGTGIQKTYKDSTLQRVAGQRTMPWSCHVNKDDARLRKPRAMYETSVVDREVLKSALNSRKTDEMIDSCPRSMVDDYPYQLESDSNLIVVGEGWRLPSRAPNPRKKGDKGTGDGLHAMCVKGGTLFQEPWTRDRHQFEFLYWIPPRIGMWGKGMVEQLLGQQIEINRSLRHIQLSMKRAGNLKVILDGGAGVLKTHINDRIGTVITHNSKGGHAPQFLVHDVVSPQIIGFTQWLCQSIYGTEGVNTMASQGQLPQGMDKASGRAIRAADNVASRRRLPFLKDCEKFDKRVSEFKIELARELYEENHEYAVTYHGAKRVELVDFGDVNMTRDQFWLRVFPTSALPPDPSARLATLDEWITAGLISKTDYRRLADFPDLEDAGTLESASWDLSQQMVQQILQDGDYIAPEPLLDNLLMARIGLQEYNRAKLEGGYPEKHLELLRQFIVAAIKNAKDPAPPPSEGPNGPAPVDPNAPPGAAPPPGEMPPPAPPPAGAPPAPATMN
jgi:hypothetical protein